MTAKTSKAVESVEIRDPADVGERADVVLRRHWPTLSRRVIRRMALEGHLHCDGKPVPPSTRVRLGTRFELRLNSAGDAPGPVDAPFVLRLTDRFVYVHKPSGMHVHRLRPDEGQSVADWIVERHPECASASPEVRECGAIHRLDQQTSGVVAFARSPNAWVAGRAAIRDLAKKYYLAVVTGDWPPSAPFFDDAPDETIASLSLPPIAPRAYRIDAPLGKAGHTRVEARPTGLAATTWVWRCHTRDDRHWLLLRLVTGRRHQARVHLRSVGLPIVGDERYGGAPSSQLHLHAAALRVDPLDPAVVAILPAWWQVTRPAQS